MNRLVFNGQSGNGTFLTTPSTCFNPEAPGFAGVYSTFLHADSYEKPETTAFPSGLPLRSNRRCRPGRMPIECNIDSFQTLAGRRSRDHPDRLADWAGR